MIVGPCAIPEPLNKRNPLYLADGGIVQEVLVLYDIQCVRHAQLNWLPGSQATVAGDTPNVWNSEIF